MILQATIEEKDEIIEKEKNMRIFEYGEKVSIKHDFNNLREEFETLKIQDQSKTSTINQLNQNTQNLLEEVEILKDTNDSLAEKDEKLQKTMQKMEKRLFNA